MELRRVGQGGGAQREWYVANALDLHSAATELRPPSAQFVLLLAADTQDVLGPQLVEAATTFIRLGASYVCCWGPGSGRLESCFDEAGVLLELDEAPNPTDDVLMTTSHEHESLEDAAWFAAWSAHPTPMYADATKALIAIAIGCTEWSERLAAYLANGAPMLDEA